MTDIQNIADMMDDEPDEFDDEAVASEAISRHIYHPLDKVKRGPVELYNFIADKIDTWEKLEFSISDDLREALLYDAFVYGIENETGLTDPAEMLNWVNKSNIKTPYFVIDGLKAHINHKIRIENPNWADEL